MPINFGGLLGAIPTGQAIAQLPSSGGGGDDGIGSLMEGLTSLAGAFKGTSTPTPSTNQTYGANQVAPTLGTPQQGQPQPSMMQNKINSAIQSNFKHGGPTTPTAIIFHDTAGPTMKSATETLQQRGLSYNYIIDKDGSVQNLVPAGMKAFHAKGYNDGTVGVSFVGGGGFGNVNPAQQEAAVKLTQQLQGQFPTIQGFAGHRDRSHAGKMDPEGFDYTGFSKATGLPFQAGPGSDRYKYDTSPGFNTKVIPQITYPTHNPQQPNKINDGMNRTPGYNPITNASGQHPELQDAMAGIAWVESRGSKNAYSLQGPTVTKGQYKGEKALGKYQVMPGNVPSWTKAATGKAYTPAEFLASPEIQEQTAAYIINQNLNKYGNVDDAMSTWFAGGPVSKRRGAKDVTGTSVPEYIRVGRQGILRARDQQGGYAQQPQVGPVTLGTDQPSLYPKPAPVQPQQAPVDNRPFNPAQAMLAQTTQQQVPQQLGGQLGGQQGINFGILQALLQQRGQA